MNPEAAVDAQIHRHFPVPAEQVFDAWLSPDLVRQWFGPGLGEVIHVEVDARVGGSFSIVQRRDGIDIDHVGQYLEIERPKLLAFTWAVRQDLPATSTVTIGVVEDEEGCRLTLIHALHPDWAQYVPNVTAAWTKMIEAMAEAIVT